MVMAVIMIDGYCGGGVDEEVIDDDDDDGALQMKHSLQSLPQAVGLLVQQVLLRLQSQHRGLGWALSALTVSQCGEQRCLHALYMLTTHTLLATRALHTILAQYTNLRT